MKREQVKTTAHRNVTHQCIAARALKECSDAGLFELFIFLDPSSAPSRLRRVRTFIQSKSIGSLRRNEFVKAHVFDLLV